MPQVSQARRLCRFSLASRDSFIPLPPLPLQTDFSFGTAERLGLAVAAGAKTPMRPNCGDGRNVLQGKRVKRTGLDTRSNKEVRPMSGRGGPWAYAGTVQACDDRARDFPHQEQDQHEDPRG